MNDLFWREINLITTASTFAKLSIQIKNILTDLDLMQTLEISSNIKSTLSLIFFNNINSVHHYIIQLHTWIAFCTKFVPIFNLR